MRGLARYSSTGVGFAEPAQVPQQDAQDTLIATQDLAARDTCLLQQLAWQSAKPCLLRLHVLQGLGYKGLIR